MKIGDVEDDLECIQKKIRIVGINRNNNALSLVVTPKLFKKPLPKLEQTRLNINVGQTQSILIDNKNIKNIYTFISSDTSVATVNELGEVKALQGGTAIITVNSTWNNQTNVIGTVTVNSTEELTIDNNNEESKAVSSNNNLTTVSPEPTSLPVEENNLILKPRVIHTTDLGADPDDEESMVRVMVTSNEFDLEGLIVVTSCWKATQNSTKMLDKIIDAYGEVYPNLINHSDGYPTYEYMKSLVKLGQPTYGMEGVGEGKDSPGSNMIIEAVDKDDSRPLWVTLWGGANTLAQALWKVQNTRTSEEVSEFVSKLRIYDVLGQDDAGAWIVTNFPDLFYLRAKGQVYSLTNGGDTSLTSNEWLSTHISSHGPLGACYPPYIWNMEGDTPSFLHIYPNGLNDPEKIDQGGWGGRFSYVKKIGVRGMIESKIISEESYDPYYMYTDAAEGGNAISRWRVGYQNDFAARMDWSITSSYSEANHHPVAVVNGDNTKRIIEISASAGSKVELNAIGSSDPDGDSLSYSWYYYREPSFFKGDVTIDNNSSELATVLLPTDAKGKSIHVILEVHDDGTPSLYAYRRVIMNVQ